MENEFIEKLRELLSEFKVGNPCSFKCSLCPLNKIVIDENGVKYDLCDLILKVRRIIK